LLLGGGLLADESLSEVSPVPLEKVGRGADVGIRRESMVRDGGDDAFDGDGTDQRGLRDVHDLSIKSPTISFVLTERNSNNTDLLLTPKSLSCTSREILKRQHSYQKEFL